MPCWRQKVDEGVDGTGGSVGARWDDARRRQRARVWDTQERGTNWGHCSCSSASMLKYGPSQTHTCRLAAVCTGTTRRSIPKVQRLGHRCAKRTSRTTVQRTAPGSGVLGAGTFTPKPVQCPLFLARGAHPYPCPGQRQRQRCTILSILTAMERRRRGHTSGLTGDRSLPLCTLTDSDEREDTGLL